MKKNLALCVALLMLLCLCACGGETANNFDAYPKAEFAGTTAAREYDELTLTYPTDEGWSVQDSGSPLALADASSADFAVLAPANANGTTSNLVLLSAAANAAVKVTDVTEAYIKSQLGEGNELSAFGYYNIGGLDAVVYTINAEQSGIAVSITQALIYDAGKQYIVTVNVFDGKYQAELTNILGNIVFKK